MGAVVGLFGGLGLLLIWQGFTSPARPARTRRFAEHTREQLAQAGLSNISPAQLLASQLVCALLAATATLVLTQSISVSVIFALFAAAVPRLLVTRLRRKRQADLRELWPEVVDNLTSGVRAGLSLPEALTAIGARGPEAMREAFRRFGSDYRTTGHFNDSLNRLKAALADPVGDRVCESLRVAREVGGTDLGRLLTTLSSFLRDDARTRAELMARQSWSVNAARMAVCAPWLVLVLLATQNETLDAYDTPTGTAILLVGAALSIGAYRLMLRIGRLPEDRRVLR
ncbi:type II secretion system F family protein [Nakamurella lactea]|uniref:type II secretion system F family protein n=1 Tax=Nakamurella lactea TaxID=459515 RepID=UPI0003F908FC|nr:type II secretion system F family protein [Nakamurella lactea]